MLDVLGALKAALSRRETRDQLTELEIILDGDPGGGEDAVEALQLPRQAAEPGDRLGITSEVSLL